MVLLRKNQSIANIWICSTGRRTTMRELMRRPIRKRGKRKTRSVNDPKNHQRNHRSLRSYRPQPGLKAKGNVMMNRSHLTKFLQNAKKLRELTFHFNFFVFLLKSVLLASAGKKAKNPSATTQVRSRLKEFPSGNKSTSTSRKDFLKSLCGLEKFRDLVDLIPSVVIIFFYLFL